MWANFTFHCTVVVTAWRDETNTWQTTANVSSLEMLSALFTYFTFLKGKNVGL
jgi:hypothetical protein